jgi:hypothetical protein
MGNITFASSRSAPMMYVSHQLIIRGAGAASNLHVSHNTTLSIAKVTPNNSNKKKKKKLIFLMQVSGEQGVLGRGTANTNGERWKSRLVVFQ